MRVINYILSQCGQFLAKIETNYLPLHYCIDSVWLWVDLSTQIKCPDQMHLFEAIFYIEQKCIPLTVNWWATCH
jgi:hypothetical protein